MTDYSPEERIIDDIKWHTKLFLSPERTQQVLALAVNSLKPVERYIWPSYEMDYELLMAIDYSCNLNQQELSNVIQGLSENQNRYPDDEIVFLLLRYMVSVIWKLDVLLLTHLEKCFLLNARWNMNLVYFTKKF